MVPKRTGHLDKWLIFKLSMPMHPGRLTTPPLLSTKLDLCRATKRRQYLIAGMAIIAFLSMKTIGILQLYFILGSLLLQSCSTRIKPFGYYLVENISRKSRKTFWLLSSDAVMSFNCFIIFVGRLLGPVLLLAFRSEIRPFISSAVVSVIKKVRLFGFFKKLDKCFLVGRMFFCNFLPILVKKLLKCSAICF